MVGFPVGIAFLGCWIALCFRSVVLILEEFFRLFLCEAGLLFCISWPCLFFVFEFLWLFPQSPVHCHSKTDFGGSLLDFTVLHILLGVEEPIRPDVCFEARQPQIMKVVEPLKNQREGQRGDSDEDIHSTAELDRAISRNDRPCTSRSRLGPGSGSLKLKQISDDAFAWGCRLFPCSEEGIVVHVAERRNLSLLPQLMDRIYADKNDDLSRSVSGNTHGNVC